MIVRFLSVLTALGASLAMQPATVLAQGQPQAQAAPQNPQVVTQFDAATISRLLLDVQTTWQVETDANGGTVYRAQAGNGLSFALSPRACTPQQGCVGLLMLATFVREDARPRAEVDDFINEYNNLSPSSKAVRAGDQAIVLQGYVNSSYGISYANAQAQLLVFGQEIQKMRASLTEFSAQSR